MKVKILSLTEEVVESRDYRDAMAIEIDGERKFEVRDGEPEDSCLSRDFSDCFNIKDLMELAYHAGKNGEEFEIEWEEVEEI
ncbi:MAG: hypothetical protein E7F09_13490 [Clostridium perfringens]|nr:hypothetical protein [Clostridium perfringens]